MGSSRAASSTTTVGTKSTKKGAASSQLAKSSSTSSSSTSKRQSKPEEEEEGEEEEEEEEEEEYEVETIVTHKKTKQGSLVFLLKWKNYPDSDNTWEKQEDLNCHDLVRQYLQEHNIDSKGNSTKPASAASTPRPKRPATTGSPPSSSKKAKTETKPRGAQKKQQQSVSVAEEDVLDTVAKLDYKLKSWEDTLLIETIGMADDVTGGQEPAVSDRNQLTVFGIDSNGNRVAELLRDVRVKAPQRLLDFLLDHLKFRS